MSVNCKEEKFTVSRKKVIFMGSILEQNILQLLLFPIFKVGLANYNFFFIIFQEINAFLTILTLNFLNGESNMIETTRRKEKNLPSKQPKQILKECMYSIKKIL